MNQEEEALLEYLFIDKDLRQENESFIQTLIELNKFSQSISATLNFQVLLDLIIELSVKIMKVEKAFLMLYSENTSDLWLKSAFNLENETEELEFFNNTFSNKILPLIKDKSTILNNQVKFVELKNFKNIIISTLKNKDKIIGYLCIINKKVNIFDDKDKYFLETIANQASIAINNAYIYEKLRTEANTRSELQRFLSRNIITKIIENKINLSNLSESAVCTILIANISEFNTLAIKSNSSKIIKVLNDYLTLMTKIIFSYDGTIINFLGDKIVALFGAPIKSEKHAIEGTKVALEMLKQLETLKKELVLENFDIKIGLHTGEVIYGNIGFPQRKEFNIMGESVDITSKISFNAPKGTILISEETYKLVKNDFLIQETIEKKEKLANLKVYQVLASNSEDGLKDISATPLRMYDRVALKTFVSILKGTLRTNGLVRDISLGGVSIGTVGTYNMNEIIYMTFKLSNSLTFRNVKGIIKYIEKSKFDTTQGKNNIIMGVEFVNLNQEIANELIDFIHKESASKLK